MSEKQRYDLTLEADFTDSVFAPAAFQILRQVAALHGLLTAYCRNIDASTEGA